MRRHALRVVAATAIAAAMAAAPTTAAQAATPTAGTPVAVVAHGDGWLLLGSGARVGLAPSGELHVDGAGVDCGWVTCTLYIYRALTRSIDTQIWRYQTASPATIAGAFSLACLPIGGVGAVICAVVGGVVGAYAIDQFNYASGHNQCVGIKFTGVPPAIVPINISPNSGLYCHD